jgi:DNA repair protein RadC
MSIQQWPKSEQPREKLLQHGAERLSDAELLAIFLRTGIQGCSAVELARTMLMQFGSLKALFAASQTDFCQIRGLGAVKYVQLQAVLEMARRYLAESLAAPEALTSAGDAKRFVALKLRGQQREVFACLFLSSQHQLIAFEELFYGTVNQAPVFPREVVKKALSYNAAAVIVTHNHPSGVAEPSVADQQITTQLIQALGLLDIRLLDHLVVGAADVYSFAENGKI